MEIGWDEFFGNFIAEKIGVQQDYFGAVFGAGAEYGPKYFAAGIPVYTVAAGPAIPLEGLAGGRTMAKFFRDLFRMPDKVEAVMDVMMESYTKQVLGVINSMPVKPFSIFSELLGERVSFCLPSCGTVLLNPYGKNGQYRD